MQCAENIKDFFRGANCFEVNIVKHLVKVSSTTELTTAGKPEHYVLISIQNGNEKNNLNIKTCWQQENTKRQDLFPTHRVELLD